MTLEFLFNLFLIIFLFYIFTVQKTSYTLGYAIILFMFSFVYFIYIGFEFVALIFMITYIGGIAIIFLFLILVLDVNNENIKDKKIFSLSGLCLILLALVAVLCFATLLQSVYNPFIFNNIEFYRLIIENFFEILESKITYSELVNEHTLSLTEFFSNQNSFKLMIKLSLEYTCNQVFTLFDHQLISKFSARSDFYNFLLPNIWENSTINFSDIVGLGVSTYQTDSFLLVLIVLFLLVALIVSIYIGSGIFQLEKF